MTAFEAIGSSGIAALIAAVLAAACAPARADDAPTPTKDWSWGGVYKADVLHGRSTNYAIGNLGLHANADAGALLGWDDTMLHAELLWNHGGKPNRRIGTTQGISNVEVARSAARIYASWIEHEFKGSGTRVLLGLYDLNSEFYLTDASALLIHPSFGIGIDFSQSGRNGPSIFPNLGLGLRVQQRLGSNFYLQAAVIDGVPGDPQSPGRTVVRLSRDDGVLLVAELGWQDRDGDGQKPGRWGVGMWHYTQPSDRIEGAGRARNQGVYALAQAVLAEHHAGRTTGFVRAGAANPRVNAVDLALDSGLLIDRPWGKDGPAAVTVGVAVARFGRAHRSAQADTSVPIGSSETAFELGARWPLLQTLALQPLLQRVWHVAGRGGAHATLVGLRLEWALGQASP